MRAARHAPGVAGDDKKWFQPRGTTSCVRRERGKRDHAGAAQKVAKAISFFYIKPGLLCNRGAGSRECEGPMSTQQTSKPIGVCVPVLITPS